MLVLPVAGNYKRPWGVLEWFDVHTKFNKNQPVGSKDQ
jgi:hypothetical protein